MKARHTLAGVLVLACMAGYAAEPEPPAPPSANARMIEELNAALESRDRVILDLLARVRALEVAIAAPPATDAAPAAREDKPVEISADWIDPPETLGADDELDDVDKLAQVALERTLIEAGGLLLPSGVIEIQPGISYSLASIDAIDIDCLLIAEILCIGDINSQRIRRERYVNDWTFRLGLPWNMQLDARVPVEYQSRDIVLGDGNRSSANSTGLGDIELALSAQLLAGRGWKPDLIGEVRWKSTTGNDPFDIDEDEVATGTGFHDIRVSLTAVKVRDPVVLFGNVNYTFSLSDDKSEVGKVDPGDSFGLQLGVAVALSMETSLNFGWSQSWAQNTRVNGDSIGGSFQRPSALRVGATYVPAVGRSIDFGIAAGLSDDSPDVEARLSFPLRLKKRLPLPW